MKNNKRSNNLSTFAALALMLVMVCVVTISGTYAKYTSSSSASDTARVAKWSFTVGGKDITKSEAITVDLFSTVNDTKGGAKETDVKEGTDEVIIAPGTTGSFNLVLANASEVTAAYTIALAETSNTKSIPVEYSLDNSTWKTATDFAVDTTANTIAAGGNKTVTVYWKWSFVGNDSTNFKTTQTDTTDTALGTAETAPSITVQATITAEQVD